MQSSANRRAASTSPPASTRPARQRGGRRGTHRVAGAREIGSEGEGFVGRHVIEGGADAMDLEAGKALPPHGGLPGEQRAGTARAVERAEQVTVEARRLRGSQPRFGGE